MRDENAFRSEITTLRCVDMKNCELKCPALGQDKCHTIPVEASVVSAIEPIFLLSRNLATAAEISA